MVLLEWTIVDCKRQALGNCVILGFDLRHCVHIRRELGFVDTQWRFTCRRQMYNLIEV